MKEATDNSPTISRKEMHKVASERVHEIAKEFTEGFRFLEDYPKSVSIFGANQFKSDHPYYADAKLLASRLAKELGYSVVTGGGPGIMEAANEGAAEAGGNSIGLLIKLPRNQIINSYISKSYAAYYFFVRKVLLTFSAEAFVFYPGGFGTMDEFFEILTLVQTQKITHVPIICVGSDYWNALKKFMVDEMLNRGAITKEELDLFHIVDDHDKILSIIKEVPVRVGVPFNGAE